MALWVKYVIIKFKLIITAAYTETFSGGIKNETYAL